MDNVNVTNISFITGFFICFEYLICKERLPHKGGVRRTSGIAGRVPSCVSVAMAGTIERSGPAL